MMTDSEGAAEAGGEGEDEEEGAGGGGAEDDAWRASWGIWAHGDAQGVVCGRDGFPSCHGGRNLEEEAEAGVGEPVSLGSRNQVLRKQIIVTTSTL